VDKKEVLGFRTLFKKKEIITSGTSMKRRKFNTGVGKKHTMGVFNMVF